MIMSKPEINQVKLPKYHQGKNMWVLRILQRNKEEKKTREYILDQDLENP